MTTEKTQKSAIFFVCEKCDYKSSKRSDYNRHILTPKHKNTTFIQLYTTKNSAKTDNVSTLSIENTKSQKYAFFDF